MDAELQTAVRAADDASRTPALRVSGLGVTWPGRARPVLEGVELTIERGECVGLAGGSGAGKSTLALALMRLLPERAIVHPATRIEVSGEAIHSLDASAMVARRGRRIGMVFQEPALALHPSIRVGELIAEGIVAHGVADASEARERASAMIARVGVPDAARAGARYAHEFSGGMRQRILLASALVLRPDVLIVDEPTTALDMTIQAQVLDLLDEMRAELGMAMLHISHDLAVLGERADRILRLEGGSLMEVTRAMSVVGAVPASSAVDAGIGAAAEPMEARREEVVAHAGLAMRDLRVRYAVSDAGRRASLLAVDGISLDVARGEAVGLVGESGSGKSSVAHAIMRTVGATGSLRFDGVDVLALRAAALHAMRRRIQLVAQDAGASLTPHLSAETLVAEGAVAHGLASWPEARAQARDLLAELALPPDVAGATPQELSAGQRQRVAIARALAVRPDLLICDEPVSALDPAARGVVLERLKVMQRTHTLSLLVITHDLESVMRLTSRLAVMYLGRIVEIGSTVSVITEPLHPFTRALIDAIPTGERRSVGGSGRRQALVGEPPSPLSPPLGCAFHPRCPHPAKDAECAREQPPLTGEAVRRVACLKQ